jgi:drug/metabolite transporter (DMT)-like permease
LTPHLSTKRGYAFVALAALFWASSGSAAKFLFNSGVTPFALVQMRITIAAVVLLLWLLIRQPSLLRIARKDIAYFVVLGFAGMAAVQFTYLYAISKIHVAAAILLEYLAPIFIALYAVVFARERLKPATVTAIAMATLGCYLVVGAYNLDILSMNKAGIIGGLGSAVSFAWYTVQSEYGMRHYRPWTVLFYALLFAAVAWNVFLPPVEAFFHHYTPLAWFWIAYVGVLGTVVPFGFYNEGINLIRATRASITGMLEPITAGVISYFFLGEVFEPWQLMGAALVIAAIVLLQVKQEADDKAPEVMRSEAVARSDAAD